jgi:hypothetical protein
MRNQSGAIPEQSPEKSAMAATPSETAPPAEPSVDPEAKPTNPEAEENIVFESHQVGFNIEGQPSDNVEEQPSDS